MSVLFDVPGPRARARQRVATAISAVIVLAIAAWVVWKLYEAGQFDAENWTAFLQPNVIEALAEGLRATVQAAVAAIIAAVIFGAILAAGRLSDHAVLRWPCIVVIEFFRATPLLLLIFFIYYGLGRYIRDWLGVNQETRVFVCLVIGLMLYNGAVLAEVFRAGILAVPKGQSEAAYAIGMRKNQVMRMILAPQAVGIMLPAIISQCVVALKDTSLGFIITYSELLKAGEAISQSASTALVTYSVIAAIFIAINYSLSRLAQWLERRMARRGRTAAKVPEEPVLTLDQRDGA